jgi:SAM-dependent methyltransferase
MDDSDDALFYQASRKVVHIDDGAIAAASHLYGELLPPDGVILDLMSAWRTHLPANYRAMQVTGLGMNAEEMRDNPQLSDYIVHNLNHDPRLPLAEQFFDGAICTVSVQYLTRPVEVFRDLYRVLKPGAVAIFTFSNRCFPTKAVAVWQATNMEQKAQIVASYFAAAGFTEVRAEDRSLPPKRGLFGGAGDPLIGVWGRRPSVEG